MKSTLSKYIIFYRHYSEMTKVEYFWVYVNITCACARACVCLCACACVWVRPRAFVSVNDVKNHNHLWYSARFNRSG